MTQKPHISFVLGGISSGKSTFAESLMDNAKAPVVYLATMQPVDDECRRKIERHRERRPRKWLTFDIAHGQSRDEDLKTACNGRSVLFDGLGQYISLEVWSAFERSDLHHEQIVETMRESVLSTVNFVSSISTELVIVSDDLGAQLVPEDKCARIFVQIMGEVNQLVAELADKVYLVEAGLPRVIKSAQISDQENRSLQFAGHGRAKRIMFQGTSSGVGKSLITAAFCRHFISKGFSTAPFKSQNMALNSFVTDSGEEMAFAQVVQAAAARTRPLVAMNPLLLKPKGNRVSQVILNGRPVGDMSAVEYHTRYKSQTVEHIENAFKRLADAHDVVVIEGAGSPAETNLKQYDLSNMAVARLSGAPVYLVADIDRGGVIAALSGTISLLDSDSQSRIKGIIINKFRGDRDLLQPALDEIEKLTGVPVVGVVPYLDRLDVPEEDSQFVSVGSKAVGVKIDIAVISFPRMSNFTDLDHFKLDSNVNMRFVTSADELEGADLVILPGTKNSIKDLEWLVQNGLDRVLLQHASCGKAVVGICGGFQMLGEQLLDPNGLESSPSEVNGLGILPIKTLFDSKKVTVSTSVTFDCDGHPENGLLSGMGTVNVKGYLIKHGRSFLTQDSVPQYWLAAEDDLDTDSTGEIIVMASENGMVFGTYLHGIFENEILKNTLIKNLLIKKVKEIYIGAQDPEPASESVRDVMSELDSFDLLAARLDSELDRVEQVVMSGLDLKKIYKDMGLD